MLTWRNLCKCTVRGLNAVGCVRLPRLLISPDLAHDNCNQEGDFAIILRPTDAVREFAGVTLRFSRFGAEKLSGNSFPRRCPQFCGLTETTQRHPVTLPFRALELRNGRKNRFRTFPAGTGNNNTLNNAFPVCVFTRRDFTISRSSLKCARLDVLSLSRPKRPTGSDEKFDQFQCGTSQAIFQPALT